MSGQRPLDTPRFARKDRLSGASARPVTATSFDQIDALQEHKARRFPSLAPTNTQTPRKEAGMPQRDELLRAVARVTSTPDEPVWGRDGERPILFNRLPTSPAFPTSPEWWPSQNEDVVVMQQSQREAWKSLGRRFDAAHDEDATSPHHARARRRSSISLPRTSSDPPPASRAHGRRASLPDHRLLSPASPPLPLRHLRPDLSRSDSLTTHLRTHTGDRPVHLRSPAAALQLRSPTAARKAAGVVRGSPLGAASTLQPCGLPEQFLGLTSSTRLGPRHMFSRQMRRVLY